MTLHNNNNYLIDQVQSGDEIEVWWPADKQYYPGVIDQVLNNGRYHITYLDGEEEVLRLSTERWRFRGKAAERVSRDHSVGARKRPRNFFATHEPEPIVIDDDDDEPAPERVRHKQRTHHSNDAVIALDGTLSLSTQQSDVEIEEVPVQRPTRSASDHRASDVSDPVVSDIEHEVIEEEVLDRGYGGDTSSAADTSELQHRNAREKHLTSQNPSTQNASKTTIATTKSTPPDSSANSHKDHRNSYSAQSASLSAPINRSLPSNARSAVENNSESILSPAPLAADQLSSALDKSLPRHIPQSIPLKLPASALNRPLGSGSKSTAKVARALLTNPNERNISSVTTTVRPALPTQEHLTLKASAGITTTTSANPTPRKGLIQAATSNPVPQRKKTGKSSASSPRTRAPKTGAQSSMKEATTGKSKKDTTASGEGQRMAGATTDMTTKNSVIAPEKAELTCQPQSAFNGPRERIISGPHHISLVPAMKVAIPSDVHPSTPHSTSLQERAKVPGANSRKNQHILGETPNKSSDTLMGPTRNPANIGASKTAAVRKQPSHSPNSSASAKVVQLRLQNEKGGIGTEAKKTTPQLPLEPQSDVTIARTQKNTPQTVVPQKAIEKQFKASTQGKIGAISKQAEAPSTRTTNIVPQKSPTEQFLHHTQRKTAVALTQVKAPSTRPGHTASQRSQAKQSTSSAQSKMIATPTPANAPPNHPARAVPQKIQAQQSTSSSQRKMDTNTTQGKAPSNRSACAVSEKSQGKQYMSFPQSKLVAAPTQAKAPSMQRTVLVSDCRQVPSAPGAGPQSSNPSGENGCHERPNAKTSNRVLPNTTSRLSQPKVVPSDGIKSTNIRQSKSGREPGAMFAVNTGSTPKQIADASSNIVRAGNSVTSQQLPMASAAMRKKARHPSPKVVSSERIPRNKALPAAYLSRSLRLDQSGKSQSYVHVGSSRPLSSTPDHRIGPKTPMKPIPHISSPTPPRVHFGNTSRTRGSPNSPNSQPLGTRTTVATQEAKVHQRSSISKPDDHKTQARAPRSPLPKSSGSISIQSLVSSPKDVTKPHATNANIQHNPPQVFLFQSHAGSTQSLASVPKSTCTPSSTSKPYTTTSSLYPAPPVLSLPTVSRSAHTLNGSKLQETKSIPQTLSSLQAVTNLKTSNVAGVGKNQASVIATGNASLINVMSSKELPPLRVPRHIQVDKHCTAQNGRKRSAPGSERLAGVTKKRRPPPGTQHSAGLRDVIEISKPMDSVQNSSEAALVRNRTKYTIRDGSVSLPGAAVQRKHGANENSALVPGATTFSPSGSRSQTNASLNSAAAKARASVQLQASTTPKVVDHFGIIGYQGTSGVSAVKSVVNVSTELPFPSALRNPSHPGVATSARPRVVSPQRVASVQPVTRIPSVPEKMCDSEDMKPLMTSALKTVDNKFSMLSKKTKQEFEDIKKSIETASREISQLGSRIDKVNQVCNNCPDNLMKVLEKSLDKKMTEMNLQVHTEARERLLLERREFVSSSKETAEKVTKVTSILFHTAVQDIKKALEANEGGIQSGVTQSSPSFNTSRDNNAATAERQNSVPENTTSSAGNESIRGIVGNKSASSSEHQPEHSHPLRIFAYQQISKSPSHGSTLQLQHGCVNESNSTGISDQRVKHQSLEAKSNDLIARCVIDWLQNGGCRKKAPRSEREIPVSQHWVNVTTFKCFENISGRLQSWSSISEAEIAIAESLAGKVVETEWLTRFTDDTCVERARSIYSGWEPNLFDFEWETEKKVMLEIAVRVNVAQRKINAGESQYADVLSRTIGCVVSARSEK